MGWLIMLLLGVATFWVVMILYVHDFNLKRMVSAKKANKMAIHRAKHIDKQELEYIKKEILKSANKGYTDIVYYSKISDKNKEILNKYGYNIYPNPDFPDRKNACIISWKDIK